MNSINVITPYKENGIWRFDDPSRELKGEPLVGEMNYILDDMVKDSFIVNTGDSIAIYFADHDFPGAEYVLWKREKDEGGSWYSWGTYPGSLKGWLCPATLKYFDQFPEKIYISLFTISRK